MKNPTKFIRGSMSGRSRRQRTTPYRACRWNRGRGSFLAPSTRARWGWKLRLCAWLKKMFPVVAFVVEDIKAESKKFQKKWNTSFSPLEVGKAWFYEQLAKLGKVKLRQGWETKELRDSLGLTKTKSKLAEVFSAHCVDSWVLANWFVGGHTKPDNISLLLITPIRLHRRQLQVQNFAVGGIRKLYGGTRSLGFKRGSLVEHPKHGLSYIGGTSKGRISLHSVETGKRLCQNAVPTDCKFKTFTTWRGRHSSPD